jgi:hypothetical protein
MANFMMGAFRFLRSGAWAIAQALREFILFRKTR